MSSAAARPTILRRLAGMLLVTLGVLAILLAVALGVFRLLIGQIPEYQAELKAWVAAELGLVVDFEAFDARLGLAGPELSLRAVAIGDGSDGDFLRAEQAAITLDSLALVFGRRIEISRLTLGGVQLTVERDRAGTFRLGEFAVGSGGGAMYELVPQSVEILIRDSVLHYVDRVREREWEFDDFEIAVESVNGRLDARASVRPPEPLARLVELDASADISVDGPDSWRIELVADTLDLGSLVELLPLDLDLDLSGTGQVRVGADWARRRLESIRYQADLSAVQVGAAAADNPPFDALGFSGDWQFGPGGAWRLHLDDVDVARAGQAWDESAAATFALERDADGVREIALAGEFLRLADLEPIVAAFPDTQLAEQWALFRPRGDIRDLDFAIERHDDNFDYALTAAFTGLGVNRVGTMPGITGVTGRVQAGEDSGSLDLASGPVSFDWPALFSDSIGIDSLSGEVSWFQSRDTVRVLGVNLGVGLVGSTASGRFDMQLPTDGRSPLLEIRAELDRIDLVAAKAYLPAPVLPESVVGWLESAVAGGEAHDVEFLFSGPVRAFPFDDGQGQFRVTADIVDAALDYMTDWPRAEQLEGRIEFLDEGFVASGSGQALSNRATRVDVAIPDLREGLLTLATETEGPLTGVVDYLRTAPLIAAHLGPDFGRLEALGGNGAISARLDLPLRDLAAFALDASLTIDDGTLAIAGFGPAISEIYGVVRAREDTVEADDLKAVFLGGPVSATLRRSDLPGYRAELAVAGETSIESVAASFAMPHDDLLAGQTLWRGRLLMPALDPLATTATRIVIESNLAGVALRFPEPLAKPPGEPSNLRLDLDFAAGNRLLINGNLGATRRFALSFEPGDAGLEFRYGAVRFGGEEPSLPYQPGILVNGRIETLPLDDWLELASASGLGRAGPSFLGTDLEISDLHAFGQRLGTTSLRVARGDDAWEITVDSEAIAGNIHVPWGRSSREPIVAEMQRFYLAAAEAGNFGAVDPRQLPGFRLEADEFGLGSRRFGRTSATVEADRRGLVLTNLTSATDNYSASMTGSWFQGPLRMRSTIDAVVTSTNVAGALTELGIDPAISGESARVEASVYFDAAPGSDWLDHLNGDVSIVVETGTLREIDPGAGRMLGLMSIAALPRRLALDFRDVFEDGFAFDEIGGSFRLIDGDAYTNDLKFSGPAAEIGVVGRTGLRNRDYTQQIVVSPEPGNMLPTVAGLLAGPGAGAALFVFTRLFKEPLKGIGQASYCLEGSWESPVVEPIDNDEQERARQCADVPDEMRNDVIDR